MKHVQMPAAYEKKLTKIRMSLESGSSLPGAFGGKCLTASKTLVSIRVGYRWRALFCRKEDGGYYYIGVYTHETYNKIINKELV